MQNVKYERLDEGLFAIYQDDGPEGVQSVILTEANIMDLWAMATRRPSADEGRQSSELFASALAGLDDLHLLPANKTPKAAQGRRRSAKAKASATRVAQEELEAPQEAPGPKKPPRRHVARGGFLRRSVLKRHGLLIVTGLAVAGCDFIEPLSQALAN